MGMNEVAIIGGVAVAWVICLYIRTSLEYYHNHHRRRHHHHRRRRHGFKNKKIKNTKQTELEINSSKKKDKNDVLIIGGVAVAWEVCVCIYVRLYTSL